MLRAISLGVFWRGALDQGDHPVDEALSPGFWVIRTTMRSESTRGATGDRRPVTTGLTDHRGRLAGDGRLVDGGDALDDLAVAGDDLASLDNDTVADAEVLTGYLFFTVVVGEATGDGVDAGLAKRGSLRLASTFRNCLGEVGENRCGPEP
jgi:hypothetical protein